MKTFLALFLIIFFKQSFADGPGTIDRWVVWNIGQGQWATHILTTTCIHYDVGGELGTFKRLRSSLLNFCGQKENRIVLSHWDYDHFLNLPYLARAVPHICWETMPTFEINKKTAQNIVALKLPPCSTKFLEKIQITKWVPTHGKTTNDSSIVHLEKKVLLPGDSTVRQEKEWATRMKDLNSVHVLVLGHHGSATSTSAQLLAHLPKLNFAIASARYVRYRHPNIKTIKRLANAHVPVLRTEDWGSIWFEP
ncbi:MAG: hydrolase [Bdellovibrionaceae bacterium]|nr:hydrolase [Bdellovibrio sp.]